MKKPKTALVPVATIPAGPAFQGGTTLCIDDEALMQDIRTVREMARSLDRRIAMRYSLTGRLGEQTRGFSRALRELFDPACPILGENLPAFLCALTRETNHPEPGSVSPAVDDGSVCFMPIEDIPPQQQLFENVRVQFDTEVTKTDTVSTGINGYVDPDTLKWVFFKYDATRLVHQDGEATHWQCERKDGVIVRLIQNKKPRRWDLALVGTGGRR
jgi:hypothetical protein